MISFDKIINFKSECLTCGTANVRDLPVEKLKDVKVADALKHPNWNMGKKITVDSATLFNKVNPRLSALN